MVNFIFLLTHSRAASSRLFFQYWDEKASKQGGNIGRRIFNTACVAFFYLEREDCQFE